MKSVYLNSSPVRAARVMFTMLLTVALCQLSQAVTTSSLSDDFGGPAIDASKWTVVDADFEVGVGTYTADQTTNPGQLTIAGVNNVSSYWGGAFLHSVDTFASTPGVVTSVNVDRVSLSGSGSAYRSALWVKQADGTFLQFAQNVGENGWQYNPNTTGSGNNITRLDGIDGTLGPVQMSLLVTPLGGSNARVSMFADGELVDNTTFSGNWENGTDFNVRVGGLARQAPNDTVSAVFDNFSARSVNIDQTTNSNTTGYAVSSSDLLSGLSATVTGTALGGQEGTSANPAVLTNGTFGPGNFSDLGEVVSIANNTTLTYGLDLGAAPFGYDITGIDTYGTWRDGGRDDQQFAVLVANVDDPSTFFPLASVDFAPPNGPDSMVSLSSLLDPLAINIAAIRFSFLNTENGYAGYTEFDVFGNRSRPTVPEPAAAVLTLMGLGALAGRRRRRTA